MLTVESAAHFPINLFSITERSYSPPDDKCLLLDLVKSVQ